MVQLVELIPEVTVVLSSIKNQSGIQNLRDLLKTI